MSVQQVELPFRHLKGLVHYPVSRFDDCPEGATNYFVLACSNEPAEHYAVADERDEVTCPICQGNLAVIVNL